jgi:asparagine synthase (glutamine-hydrolysing)
LVAHVPFADAAVVDYALRIPVRHKIVRHVEKWIVRQAMEGLLPRRILERPKAKFWEGTGLGAQIAAHADNMVSNAAFLAERMLPNGWILNTKEELLYYRAFRDRFGDLGDFSWMGRTKGAPLQ